MKKVNGILSEITDCRDISAGFLIRLESGDLLPERTEVEINRKTRRGLIYNFYGGVEETEWFAWDAGRSTWSRSIRNVSGKTLHLKETALVLKGIGFGKGCAPEKDYYYHVENPRIYKMMAMPVDLKLTPELVKKSGWDCLLEETKYFDPAITCERIGASPYQPFPAALLSNHDSPRGLVHGSLSQKVFYHNYVFRHEKGRVAWEIFSSLKGIDYRIFLPGETLDGDTWYIGTTTEAGDIGRIFSGYLDELRKHLPVSRGRTPTNRHSVMWGSSNDGPVQDIDQERILKTAEFARKNLPAVEWIYIDWGYGKTGDFKGGMSVPYEGEQDIDPNKFPEGMKKFADRVRQTGMKPSIWIANMIERKTRLAKEHPEWLYDRFPSEKGPRILDISIPEVRSYMEKALDRLITEYGFEGVKHDLWSYSFEDSRPLFSRKEKSGYELRNWWTQEMRKRLPPWGYMQTGCDIVMGNPLLGELFNNYRYGIDINEGNWDNVETNMLWGAACFALRCGDLFIPNSDAIGILGKLKDREYMLWLNYCIVSRSILETGGWLHKNCRHPRYRLVKKAMCCLNNGQDVYFCGYDYRKTHSHPDRWYFEGAHFSLLRDNPHLPARTIAFFNTGNTPRTFRIGLRHLKLEKGEYTATDVWTLKTCRLEDYDNLVLEPKGSILFSVNRKDKGIQVLDSDTKIDAAVEEKGKLRIDIAHGGDFCISVSRKPSRVSFSEKGAMIRIVKGEGNWRLEGKTPSAGSLFVSY